MLRRITPSRLGWLVLPVLAACAAKPPAATEVQGACADAFGSQVCTLAHVQGDSVIDVQATIPIASIEGAPAEAPETWPPTAVASSGIPASVQVKTGLTELTMYWEAHGHPPGPYLTPHFDFHFYLVPPSELAAMDCTDTSKPSALPAGYSLPDVPLPPDMAKAMGAPDTLVGLCVPQMGMHALPTAELESGQLFTGDMLVGYYAGKPIFLEPMLTKTLLMQKKSFSYPIPSVPGMSGPHPTTFRADWDAQAQAYQFIFSGFTTT